LTKKKIHPFLKGQIRGTIKKPQSVGGGGGGPGKRAEELASTQWGRAEKDQGHTSGPNKE